MTIASVGPALLSRRERFATVGSTNDVVRDWLAAGVPEVCLAVADEQTAGRGRDGRSWSAAPGRALLLSLGFRPSWLAPERVWRLPAIVSLAMAEAAEEAAGLAPGTVRLKWPNDLVVEQPAGPAAVRKLAGVLGETTGLGSDDPLAIVGIGVNAGWPASEFPPVLAATMTSLEALGDGRLIDRDGLLEGFLERLAAPLALLRDGRFDEAGWAARQVTTGRLVRLSLPDGSASEVLAAGVDPASGALLVEDPGEPRGRRAVMSGEILHLRLARV